MFAPILYSKLLRAVALVNDARFSYNFSKYLYYVIIL